MRVFRALIAQRVANIVGLYAVGIDEETSQRIAVLESIGSDHIFQSDVSLGAGVGMSYAQRKRILWTYRGAERYVLFNCDLLSTGIDLPCCGGVFEHAPSNNSDREIQRAGRCLRLDPMRLDKVGTFALPCADPYERSAEEDMELRELLTGFDMQYDLAVMCAEAMMDESLKSLGRLFTAYGFGRGGASGDDESDKPKKTLAQLLQLLIRQPSGKPATIPLTAADMSWFEKAFKACGRQGLLYDWDLQVSILLFSYQ